MSRYEQTGKGRQADGRTWGNRQLNERSLWSESGRGEFVKSSTKQSQEKKMGRPSRGSFRLHELEAPLIQGNDSIQDGVQSGPHQRYPCQNRGHFTKKNSQLGILDSKTVEFLTKRNLVIPVFNTLLKIHKNLQNPPGRPIETSTESILTPISIFLEKIVTPIIQSTPSFLLDTGAFLNRIRTR
ncbi:unnamed protein product [Ranitomeya imitator]|uniref:Uncharacterized protein n=1 Tax=Ranitomeya imitator TaxID=111125 RepID=A0ABN9KTI6_9NEOB|nr:unnamed protein product [Ranitomeya imitator]